uniref:Thioredoxin domain-containing protein n=1 Tax=Chromera velia CCMP2878 TaxID=1169474 RepID=A0A0G4H4G2_9ALVE|eukprot:Cvel_24635.t1-p1 / transcript=Cvel_24635.t1 / gene=Cvel_24635 / organism=Chromera_velia_CCMP2878 / gene_product=Protein sco1, putative / transcript_product=Protein sco1, putative / location=Cvel_scaffold2689:19731-21067(-) / protein_length=319 / sequence_SO=supercontig / SO=protein_coding / is_pseudo=false
MRAPLMKRLLSMRGGPVLGLHMKSLSVLPFRRQQRLLCTSVVARNILKEDFLKGPTGEMQKPPSPPKSDDSRASSAEEEKRQIKQAKKAHQQSAWTMRSALVTSALCGAIYWLYSIEMARLESKRIAETSETTIGKPNLGCDWTLTGKGGKKISSADFRGKYQLIYFGFVLCPDICPQEMEKQAQVIEIIDKKYGELVQPIFITVDPRRDDPDTVQEYCEEFHPRLIGLTGTEEDIKGVTKAFRVYYNTGIKSGEDDYLVDHSIIHYLMGKNGKFKDFFGKNLTVREYADKVIKTIEEDLAREKMKKKGQASDDDDDDD